MISGHRGHTIFRLLMLPLLGAISACNGTQGSYASGPWGRAGYLDPSVALYPKPWNRPLDPSLVEQDPAPPPSIRRAAPDIMEPIGAWTSRDVTPLESDSISDDSNVVASIPPLMSDDNKTSEPTPANRLASPAEPRPSSKPFTSLTGQWTAQESGRTCRLQLSSTPTLDLYKASASDCANDTLQNVNSWAHRDRTLVLYARGRVTARLHEDGEAFSGTLEGTKTPVRISR